MELLTDLKRRHLFGKFYYKVSLLTSTRIIVQIRVVLQMFPNFLMTRNTSIGIYIILLFLNLIVIAQNRVQNVQSKIVIKRT